MKRQLTPNTRLNFKKSGLTLRPTHPFLGASGDGWIEEDGELGIIEVKTIYSIDRQVVTDISPTELARNPKCCLEVCEETGKPHLKRSHNYFYQVQGEVNIMDVPWCDFVVWTKAGIFIERISRDQHLWEIDMLPRLLTYYKNVAREILQKDILRGINLTKTTD